MKELGSVDARIRKDLNFIKREQVKSEQSKPKVQDKVHLGQQPLLAEQGDGLQATGSETKPTTIACDTTVEACLWEPTLLMEEPSAPVEPKGQTLAEIAQQVAKEEPKAVAPEAKPEKRSFGAVLSSAVASVFGHPSARFKKSVKKINKLEAQAKLLKTPADFKAKKAEFVQRLAKGETLEDIRDEATAVARQATFLAQKKRPFDCQVNGALAMGKGHIAEMRTGEGKTLTAIMPLYLNALAGKGAHLVTVNDTLADNGAKDNASTFELLGMSVGCALEGMDADQKRDAYAKDVTYVSNHTLGFDFLRDQTAKRPEDRVQREPFYALVDEADEVFLEEAQTPLIISGQVEKGEGEYETFHQLVSQLKPGDDFKADPDKNTAWLTESGMDWVEAKLQTQELEKQLNATDDPGERKKLLGQMAQVEGYAYAIRKEQAAERALKADELNEADQGRLQKSLDAATSVREDLAKEVPVYNLYGVENLHRSRFLNNALKARVLFHKDEDYMVDADGVQIVDKNKGRTSAGRRYSSGLHQALEAKEGVEIQAEQRTTASITYPNLFKRYPRLAGMSGTAWTSRSELYELYGLEVVQVDTNKEVIRKDEPDQVFKTQEEKYTALARDAAQDFFDGKPVLIGTLSVEHNHYVLQQLLAAGVPEDSLQVLNAESVKGNKELENEMLADAGRSGVVTVATNLAGRGANIKPDLINYKKISMDASAAAEKGKPVVIELEKAEDAEWMGQWLGELEPKIVGQDSRELPKPGEVTIRVGKKKGIHPSGGLLIDGGVPDYQTGGLTVYGSERAESRRIDDQLIGRAGRQGAPGRSKFYLSLEDELFQKHGGSGLKAMQGLFSKPGQGLSGMIFSKLIDNAQGGAEATYAEMRETTTKHDEVLNLQRENYFGLRDEIVEDKGDVKKRIATMAGNAMVDEVFDLLPDKKVLTQAQIREAVGKAEKELGVPIKLPFLDPELKTTAPMKAGALEDEILDYADRSARNATKGKSQESLRSDVLDIVDDKWAGHLEEMEELKSSSQWQTLAQADPEVHYKIESANVFEQTLREVNRGALRWVAQQAK